MKPAVGFAVATAGCYGTAVVHAKALKWSRDADADETWKPAQETLGALAYIPQLNGGMPLPAPMVTAAPTHKPRGALVKGRAATDNTCAYMNGESTASLWCDASMHCASNSINSHVGCCEDATITNCQVWTSCLHSTQSARFTTNNGLTLWCGSSAYPNCITHIYQTGFLSGYSILGCAVAAGTGKIYYTPTTSITPKSSETETDTDTDITSDPTSPPTIPPGPQFTDPLPPPSQGSTANIGAIVGGVVGGVAALALIALGIWLLVRQNNKHKAEAAAAVAASGDGGAGAGAGGGTAGQHQAPAPTDPNSHLAGAGGAPGGMTQIGAGAAAAVPVGGYYGRDSIAKPPYGTQTNSMYDPAFSPPGSPTPGYQAYQTPSPPPPPNGTGGGVAGGYWGQQGQGQLQGQAQQQQEYHQQYAQGQQPQPQPQPQHAQQQPQGHSPQGFQPASPYGYPPPPQPQPHHPQPHQAYAELSTQRGDGDLRELQG